MTEWTYHLDIQDTGGPPLTRKSLTRFPLPRFLAYVLVSVGPPTVPHLHEFHVTRFFQSPKMRVRRGPSVGLKVQKKRKNRSRSWDGMYQQIKNEIHM